MDQESKTPNTAPDAASRTGRSRLPWNTPRLTLLSGQATGVLKRPKTVEVGGTLIGTYRPAS